MINTITIDKIVDIYHRITSSDSNTTAGFTAEIATTANDKSNELKIFKDEATNTYKWLAVYSNSFRDEDGTPEIIGSKSHKDFVEKVDAGIYDYPDLLLWHNPKWKFGKATVVAYDEVEPGIVFAIAGGDIDEGKEHVAEALLESGVAWKNSHGMPTEGIVRERGDSTIYEKHITTEITVLPGEYAANPLTGFGLLGDDRMISNSKKAELMGKLGVSKDVILELENMNKHITDTEKDTRQFKETAMSEQTNVDVQTDTQPVEVAENVTEQITEEVVEEAQDQPADHELDIQAILDANKGISDDINEIKESLNVVADAIGTLSIAQKNLSERVDSVEKAREEEVTAQTPSFSAQFKDRIDSIVGNPVVAVKEQEGEKEFTGPKQEKSTAELNQVFGSSFLGELVSKGRVGDR